MGGLPAPLRHIAAPSCWRGRRAPNQSRSTQTNSEYVLSLIGTSCPATSASGRRIDQLATPLHQSNQERKDRIEVTGPLFRSGSQTFGHSDRLGHRAVYVGFLIGLREGGFVRHERHETTPADGPAD